MEQLTSQEKITLSIILNHQNQKNAEALAMWERIRKETTDEERKGEALRAIIYYQNEIQEIKSMLTLEELKKALQGGEEQPPKSPKNDTARERLEIERQRLELAKERAEAQREERRQRLELQRAKEQARREEQRAREEARAERERRERRGWLVGLLVSVGSVVASVLFALWILSRY